MFTSLCGHTIQNEKASVALTTVSGTHPWKLSTGVICATCASDPRNHHSQFTNWAELTDQTQKEKYEPTGI